MLSVFSVMGLLMFASPLESSIGQTTISEERCSGSRCRDAIGFAVNFEVCEVLVENSDMSKARKGTARIESVEIDGVDIPDHELVGVEREIPVFFVHLDSASVGELVPSTSTKDESLSEDFIEVKVKDGKVYAEYWRLSDEVMYFLTEDCRHWAARQ